MANNFGKKCDICKCRVFSDIYCVKCWKIVLALTVDPERYHLVREFLNVT